MCVCVISFVWVSLFGRSVGSRTTVTALCWTHGNICWRIIYQVQAKEGIYLFSHSRFVRFKLPRRQCASFEPNGIFPFLRR